MTSKTELVRLGAMKIIDARSGQQIVVGQFIDYGDGEGVTLIAFKAGIFSARMRVRSTYRDHSKWTPGSDVAPPLVTTEQWVEGPVRYVHPEFPWQRVAFLPS
jgi:hypothetical protein